MSSTATRTIRSSGRCPAPRAPDGGIGFPWDEGVVAMRIWQRKRQKPDMPWRCSDGKPTEPWEKAGAGGRKSGVLEREPSQEVALAAIRAAEEAGDQGPPGACIRCQAGALGDFGGILAR